MEINRCGRLTKSSTVASHESSTDPAAVGGAERLHPAAGRMKRTPLKRATRLKAKRATSRRAKNRCPEFLVWIRSQDCCLGGAIGYAEAAHVHARRNGGDVANVIPLCSYHHAQQHRMGIRTFAAEYGLDLEIVARHYWETYLLETVKGRAFRQEMEA